jgi:hypothetical protein
LPQWKNLTSDDNILQIVEGLKLEFENNIPPQQEKIPFQVQYDKTDAYYIDKEINNLLQKGVLVQCEHEEGEYINTIFTRPKKDGNRRMILNLKNLNQHIVYHKFKMDTLTTVLKLMNENCYMAHIDLKDAYYMVSIHESHQKYLKFLWRQKLYKFVALPNGYSAAPRQFTKLLKPIFSYLRKLGIIVMGYIDDIYVQAQTYEDCVKHVQFTVTLFEKCGFLINKEKSQFIPSKSTVFLGFEINSEKLMVKPTAEKIANCKLLCEGIVKKVSVSIREFATLIGKIISIFPGSEYGPLHFRDLEREKTHALRENDENYDANIKINNTIKNEINWWIENVANSKNNISRGIAECEIKCDATKLSWGAIMNNQRTGGNFSQREKTECNDNINAFELLAAKLALESFEKYIIGKIVLIRSDNTTTVSYILHMGGSKSDICNIITKQIWSWCIQRQIWITCEYLPGIFNVDADWESRHVNDRTEWSLDQNIFQKIIKMFGKPDIDLFASRLNKKLDKFVSWRPQPGSEHVNAFSISWKDFYAYCFPPFSVIAQVLQHIRRDQAEVLIIVPLWSTQPWFSTLLQMLIADPVMIPMKKTLTLPHNPGM